MNKDTTLREWIAKFNAYEFHVVGTQVAVEAGWYDWFCAESALTNKTKKLGKLVCQVAESPFINKDTMYVWFKNNCPMVGPLYDDFRIADIKTGDVIFNVTPKSGHSRKAEVWGKVNDFKEPLAIGTWRDVRKFFGV